MNENMMSWLGYRILVIEALVFLNGKASTGSVSEYIIKKQNVQSTELKKVKRNISFAKTYLKKYGIVKGMQSKTLQLESRFMDIDLDETNRIIRKSHRIHNLAREIANRSYAQNKSSSERYVFKFDGEPYFVEFAYLSNTIVDSNFNDEEIHQLLENIESYREKYEINRLKQA